MMKTGAFAMLDCLGFKGIWNKTKPETVLEKLKTAASKKQEIVKRALDLPMEMPEFEIEVAFLSDTVVIGLSFSSPLACDDDKGMLVLWASQIAYEYANEFRQGNVPLVFRGCIGYGQFIIEGNFILGPIVDEVASHMRLAEGAFIWLLPEAGKFVSAFESYMTKETKVESSDFLIAHVTKKHGEQTATILKEKLNQTDWGDLEILRPLIKKVAPRRKLWVNIIGCGVRFWFCRGEPLCSPWLVWAGKGSKKTGQSKAGRHRGLPLRNRWVKDRGSSQRLPPLCKCDHEKILWVQGL